MTLVAGRAVPGSGGAAAGSSTSCWVFHQGGAVLGLSGQRSDVTRATQHAVDIMMIGGTTGAGAPVILARGGWLVGGLPGEPRRWTELNVANDGGVFFSLVSFFTRVVATGAET